MHSYLLVLSPMALTYLSYPSTMGSHLSASPQPDSPALIWPWLWFSPSLSEMGHTPHPHAWVTDPCSCACWIAYILALHGLLWLPWAVPFLPSGSRCWSPWFSGPLRESAFNPVLPRVGNLCYFSFLSKLISVEQPQRPTDLSQTLPARLNTDTEVY